MSSEAAGMSVNIDAVLDLNTDEEVGLVDATELLAFVDAVETDGDIESTRSALEAAVGSEGVIEAAATIAAFNGLIRVADGTGIQLDDGLDAASAQDRERTGINNYAGSANTPRTEPTDVGSNSGNSARSDPKALFSPNSRN